VLDTTAPAAPTITSSPATPDEPFRVCSSR
jgi:hypothetical protein